VNKVPGPYCLHFRIDLLVVLSQTLFIDYILIVRYLIFISFPLFCPASMSWMCCINIHSPHCYPHYRHPHPHPLSSHISHRPLTPSSHTALTPPPHTVLSHHPLTPPLHHPLRPSSHTTLSHHPLQHFRGERVSEYNPRQICLRDNRDADKDKSGHRDDFE
jgi:hypothetical protein